MSARKLITVFGATGNQGGSVIDTVLNHPTLAQKYSLRGITRDASSEKSKALAIRGVEMVVAQLDDVESLQTAVRGSYGVFGVTDFWSHLDKAREIQQGKNIFDAAKSESVQHVVFSSLPYAEKLTNGVLKHVAHFDSKAQVEEYMEANKGSVWTSYFKPAMFISALKSFVKPVNGTPTINMPFPSDSINWPLIDVNGDSGKFVMGLFEGNETANGVAVNGVSAWTSPKEVVEAVSEASGRKVVFNTIPAEVFAGFMPPPVAKELTETMLLVGDYEYYGKGEMAQQSKYNKWLVSGTETIDLEQWVGKSGPWKFD